MAGKRGRFEVRRTVLTLETANPPAMQRGLLKNRKNIQESRNRLQVFAANVKRNRQSESK